MPKPAALQFGSVLASGLPPDQALINVARAHIGVREQGTNAGEHVERWQRLCGAKKGDPWCACFVAAMGRMAFADKWPAPLTASCLSLGEWGSQHALLDRVPELGALLLVYHAIDGGRFAHVGIITAVNPDGTVRTIEGNTNEDGGREGWKVCAKVRTIGARDAVLHWRRIYEGTPA